ncbi:MULTISPECIES: heavy-metal-associated domain-containing protein [Thiomicrorhabdus]|uniref:Heavy-metal-associated domain-containing protein n=1 Tax=Thiomicrorhabdus xiamenensis TaxID=2739063 RepID=A0A7D4SIS5_9GAMM|nr:MULTISPECIES: heavy-metal-associated domain-containing protein [Thiomicrorhabdus]MBO1923158.1 heavy-metal-associated domain-containing protein [Thiomicrorhabdus sp. 6S3-12]QKI89940.1 heavy-metal-associated domain-containing protein [Thiomicrorhabdus xiamenensis]
MRYQLDVENIKCGGCAASISNKLQAIEGVLSVEVAIEEGIVTLETAEENDTVLQQAREALLSMGYPESGTVEGTKALGAKAKSFVSCAVGKMAQK